MEIENKLVRVEIVFHIEAVTITLNNKQQRDIHTSEPIVIRKKQQNYYMVFELGSTTLEVPIKIEEINTLCSRTTFVFRFIMDAFEGNMLLNLPSGENLIADLMVEQGKLTIKAMKDGDIFSTVCTLEEIVRYDMNAARIELQLWNGQKNSTVELLTHHAMRQQVKQKICIANQLTIDVEGTPSYKAIIAQVEDYFVVTPWNSHMQKVRILKSSSAAFFNKGKLMLLENDTWHSFACEYVKELCELLSITPKKMLQLSEVKGWINGERVQLENMLLWIQDNELVIAESNLKKQLFMQSIQSLSYGHPNLLVGRDILLECMELQQLATILPSTHVTIVHDQNRFPYKFELSDTLSISNCTKSLVANVQVENVKKIKVNDLLQLVIGKDTFSIEETAYTALLTKHSFNSQQHNLMEYSINQLLKPRAKKVTDLIVFECFSQYFFIQDYVEKQLNQPSYNAEQVTAHATFIFQSMFQQRLRMEEISYALPRFLQSLTEGFIGQTATYRQLQKEIQQLHVTMKAITQEIENVSSQITFLHTNQALFQHQLQDATNEADTNNLLVTGALGIGMSALTGGIASLVLPALTGAKMLANKEVNEKQKNINNEKELSRNLFYFRKLEQLLQQLLHVTFPEYIGQLKELVQRFLKQEAMDLVKGTEHTEQLLKEQLIQHTFAIHAKLSLPVHESTTLSGAELVEQLEKRAQKELIKFF